MLDKKLAALLFIIFMLIIMPTSCGDTDIPVENLEIVKPSHITIQEVDGEVEVERIDSFRNVKGGFTNYSVKFVGVEYPSATKYQEAHVAMFHSADLGIAIQKRLVEQGTRMPAIFIIKKADDVIKDVTIKEIMEGF